jgi:hypothetical protein
MGKLIKRTGVGGKVIQPGERRAAQLGDAERQARAAADPDAQPLDTTQLARLRCVNPSAKRK